MRSTNLEKDIKDIKTLRHIKDIKKVLTWYKDCTFWNNIFSSGTLSQSLEKMSDKTTFPSQSNYIVQGYAAVQRQCVEMRIEKSCCVTTWRAPKCALIQLSRSRLAPYHSIHCLIIEDGLDTLRIVLLTIREGIPKVIGPKIGQFLLKSHNICIYFCNFFHPFHQYNYHHHHNYHFNHHHHHLYFFLSYAQNVVFDVQKKRTKLPKLGGGGSR